MTKGRGMTKEEYTTYRQQILSKAKGSDIHELNGCLGRVLNTIDSIEYWRKQSGPKAMRELGKVVEIHREAKEDIQKLINI